MFQDSWRLNEGFVAAEGVAILPHLGATGPDIIEIHLALLLQCFLEVRYLFTSSKKCAQSQKVL